MIHRADQVKGRVGRKKEKPLTFCGPENFGGVVLFRLGASPYILAMTKTNYLSGYPAELQRQIEEMIERDTLGDFLQKKHPKLHDIRSDSALRDYTLHLKNRYMKKAAPISKVAYDNKIHVIHGALGTHTYASRKQGSKLKSKNEIRIAAIFKKVPEGLLKMIVVHELAHLKERAHDKAFYQLCEHMLPDYHQREFEMRLYLTHLELTEK